jgi:Flp pilus assembly protein TadD
VALQLLGDTLGARAAYADALRLAPEDPLVWSNMASLDASVGHYEDARVFWGKALEMQPGFDAALEGLAKLDRLHAIAESARRGELLDANSPP